MLLEPIPMEHFGHRLGHGIAKGPIVVHVIQIEDMLTDRMPSIAHADESSDIGDLGVLEARDILLQELGFDIDKSSQRFLGLGVIVRIFVHVERPLDGTFARAHRCRRR